MSNAKVRMTIDEVRALAHSVLEHCGLAPAHVAAVAETIVAGERDGCTSHGLYRLLVCARTIRAGKVAVDAEPAVLDSPAALVRVDARGGYAQLAFAIGRPLLEARAHRHGIAAMAITNCVHFAALWPEVEALAEAGLVAFACTPSHAWVAPAGGNAPILGTNPIAFGWPRKNGRPYVFDFATSAVARGEIELHAREGREIPEDWAIDAEGRPTRDARAALAGAMRTFGGHKGSALSTMVELIAGPLIGDLTSRESMAADGGAGASPLGGELIIAVDPAGFLGSRLPDELDRAEALFAGIEGQGARLPSARRYAARAVSDAEGVLVSASMLGEIRALLH